MRVIVTTESRFDRTPDGKVWTQSMFTHQYWRQYLGIFDQVCIVARVQNVPITVSGWARVDGEGVSVAPVPYYLGPWQYALRSAKITRAVRQAFNQGDAVIGYVGRLTSCLLPLLQRTKYPYGMYVIGDPQDVFASGAIRHSLRPFFRWWMSRTLRQQCAHASAVAYVSNKRLQQQYPPANGAFATHFAMQGLGDEWFVDRPRQTHLLAQGCSLIAVGSLAQLYKGPDVLLDAVAACVRDGLDLRLIWIGEGKHRAELQMRAAQLGIETRVDFRGQLTSGAAIRTELDKADLFVMPSKAEGLGLAFIEAMARGLPCIGSAVGGIPEYLPAEDMVPPGDTPALVRKIREVLIDSERRLLMSVRNIEKAREYHISSIAKRQAAFYVYVKDRTEDWFRNKGCAIVAEKPYDSQDKELHHKSELN